MMVAGGWWLVRASMSIQQHGARQSCTLWALDTRHTCTLGQSDEYWNCIGYKILDKLCCSKWWIDPLKLPNYPEWWLGPVAGCWVHSVQVCRPSVGVRGRYSLVLGWLGWAGLGWELVLVFISTATRFLDSTSTAWLQHQPPATTGGSLVLTRREYRKLWAREEFGSTTRKDYTKKTFNKMHIYRVTSRSSTHNNHLHPKFQTCKNMYR